MVERTLIDILKYKSGELAIFWRDRVRKTEQLKLFNAMSDDMLVSRNATVYPFAAQWFERGADRAVLGAFFVKMGKEYAQKGVPVSELLYSLFITQETITEYLMSETVLDSSLLLYQVVDVMTRMSEFFLLASFYLTKGFLEETYLRMNATDKIPEELLKRYFKDDFFFKDKKPS